MIGERVYPVAPLRLGRVVRDGHAHGREHASELRLAPRHGAGYAHAGADVCCPGVLAALGKLPLCPSDVLVAVRRRRASRASPRRSGGDAGGGGRLQRGHAETPRDLLEGPRERFRVGVLQPPPRLDVGVVHDHVGVRDAVGVVVVVDDGDLVVREALPRPPGRERAQAVERDPVLGSGDTT